MNTEQISEHAKAAARRHPRWEQMYPADRRNLEDIIQSAITAATADLERQLAEAKAEAARCPNPLFGWLPQTYGEAVIEGWIQHGDVEPHEWDNRTTAENAKWMIERLRAANAEQAKEIERLREAIRCAWGMLPAEEFRDSLEGPDRVAVEQVEKVLLAALAKEDKQPEPRASGWRPMGEFDRTEMQFVLVHQDGAQRLYLWNPSNQSWEYPYPFGAKVFPESDVCASPTHWRPLPENPEGAQP